MYHDFGAIPNRRRSSRQEESSEREAQVSTRSSRLSSLGAVDEEQQQSDGNTPTSEGGRKIVPERTRQKKREFSPEVEQKKQPSIVVAKKLDRKSTNSTTPARSTPVSHTPSPLPPELGKRETRKKKTYSPSPEKKLVRRVETPVQQREEPPVTEERFPLSSFIDSAKKDGEIPVRDFELPKSYLKAWRAKAKKEAEKAKEQEEKTSTAQQEEQPSPQTATFAAVPIKQEVMDTESNDSNRPLHECLFEQTIAIKQEEPDEEEMPGPSQTETVAVETEEVDIKPTILPFTPAAGLGEEQQEEVEKPKSAASKRRKSAGMEPKAKKAKTAAVEETVTRPTTRRSTVVAVKEEAPAAAAEEVAPEEPSAAVTRSRRSTAGFQQFMAEYVGSNKTRATPKAKAETKTPKAKKEKKPAVEVSKKEEVKEVEAEEAGPSSSAHKKQRKVSKEEPKVEQEAVQEDKVEEEEEKPQVSVKRTRSRRDKSPTPEPDPTPTSPVSTRRSSRASAAAAAAKASETVVVLPTTPTASRKKSSGADGEFKVTPKPGSALEILKKSSRYARVQRSPTPDTTATPTSSPALSRNSSSQLTPEKARKEAIEMEQEEPFEEVEEEDVPPPSTSNGEQEKRDKDLQEEDKLSPADQGDVDGVPPSQPLNVPVTPSPAESALPTTFDSPKGTIKITPKGRRSDKAAQTALVSPKEPEPVATRRSSRALKPKVLSEDFVFDVPSLRKDAGMDLPSPTTPTARTASTPKKTTTPAKPRLRSSGSVPEDETAAEKTRKYVEEHRGPIRLSIKIGKEPPTTGIKEPEFDTTRTTTSEEDVLEEDTGEEDVSFAVPELVLPSPTVRSKSKKSKDPQWWNDYTPTPKPVLENFIRPDGTVEHLGVVVNSVMDAVLLKVCDDGIRRHTNPRAREARKAEMSEIAKKRYYDKKAQVQERLARGEPVMPAVHKKSSAEIYAHKIATRDRPKRAAIYKSNEYLLKPVRQQREEEEESEQRAQQARDYLSKHFLREAEEDLRQERKEARFKKDKAPKTTKHVAFQEFVEVKGPATASVLRPTKSNPDFFHREILREPEERCPEADQQQQQQEEEEISVDVEDQEHTLQESLFSADFMEQARSAAERISTLMLRGGLDIFDLMERIREETELRQAIIANTIEVLIEFQQVQLGAEYSASANVTMHNEALKRAHDLRDSFCIKKEAEKETMSWAHAFLVQHLPVDYLSGYLILLRYWKHQTSSSVASFAKKPFQEEPYPWPEVTEIIWSYIANKVVDPDRENLQQTIDAEALSDVIFVLVPPAFHYGDYSYVSKAHDTIFRWLKTIGSKESFILKMDYESRSNETIYEAVDFFVKIIKTEVAKLVRETRDKRIVLVGWRLSCYLNHRVVQLTHGVSAIIDLAFSLKTKHGYRGGPDDDILLTYCPSLFVVGAEDISFNATALKELRNNMQSETGAIIVHHADEHLYVPSYLLNRYRITQRAVCRSIVGYITDFLQLSCTKKERSQLIQCDLNSVYNIELESLKAISTGGGGTAAAGGGPQRVQKHATIDGGKPPSAPRQRKRKIDYTLPPSLLATPQAMPSLLAEAAEGGSSTTTVARYKFDEIVRNARAMAAPQQPLDLMSPGQPRTAPVFFKSSPLPSPSIRPSMFNPLPPRAAAPPLPSPLSLPSPAAAQLQPFAGPLASPALPPTAPPPQSSHPLDPANISLS